uniref:Uncharacterized protein TCIL3000_11_7370 n=1 Tax=Trypanosoma congolense (strain IL3000) TaxID=1068625 RepID=G0V0Y3_TRYCI|nr:unnamed protein product [Trypanosoma congolense IL3000]
MAEPVIAKPRKQALAAVLASEAPTSVLQQKGDTAAAATGTLTPVGAPLSHVPLRADAPLLVNPSRRRSSASRSRPRLDMATYSPTAAKSTKTSMRDFIPLHITKAKEDQVEQCDKTVIVQHSTIRKPLIAPDARENSALTPKRISAPPKPISPLRRGWCSVTPSAKGGERTPCESTRDKVITRSPAQRRSLGAGGGRMESPASTPVSSKSPTVTRGIIGAFGPYSPLSSLRLADLERPGTKGTPLSSASKVSSAKRARMQHKVVNLSLCKYSLLRIVAQENGFKIQELEDDLEKNTFNIVWSDTVLPLTRLVRLANWQRTNHFPSMYLLCRKGHLGITLGRMRKVMPSHYFFYPRTWSLRSERHQFARFLMALRSKKLTKFFIMKPNSGCQGRGIVITRDPLNAVEELDNYIVQEYITRPLLLEERKFDLRVYVLLTSIRAPSIFMFNDGLVRQCTEIYERPTDVNVRNTCKHLTNYAVNKHNPEYVFNADSANCNVGNKRNFKFFNEWLVSNGKSVEQLWDRVAHVICKTILVAQPQITNVYNSCFPRHNSGYTCFEVLGFDILIDSKMKPWLMEVNHTPSLATDTPLDYEVKHALVSEVWDILDIKATDRRRDERRERDEFIQRVMRIPTSAPTVTTLGNRRQSSGDATSATSANSGSAHSHQMSASMATGGVSTPDPQSEWEKAVEERRAIEDSRLRNFRRIYPSSNPEWQALYDTIMLQARGFWSAPFTPGADDRARRGDTTSVGAPSQTMGSTGERNGRGVTTDMTGDASAQPPANSLRSVQRPKIHELSTAPKRQRRGIVSAIAPDGASTPLVSDQGGLATYPQAPLLRPPQLPLSTDNSIITVHDKDKKSSVASRVCLSDSTAAEVVTVAVDCKEKNFTTPFGPQGELAAAPWKANVVTAQILSPVGRASARPLTSVPHEFPSNDRIEALRTLQQRLDQEAECEISATQMNADKEDSFDLDE